MKYNHACEIAFEVVSENEEFPAVEEIVDGLRKRWLDLQQMDEESVEECVNVYNTHREEEE